MTTIKNKDGYLFSEKEMRSLIKSISYNQDSIIQSIIELYIPEGKIELDPCYGKGCFYKSGKIQTPKYRFDIRPAVNEVKPCNCKNLPFEDNSINSIIFDPPFIAYPGKNLIKKLKRYGTFRTYNDLKNMYKESFKEFYRILKRDGILIIKCQDATFGRDIIFIHIDDVIIPCRQIGFKEVDLFILLSKGRIENRDGKQRHSRKYHCYFIVFKKRK